MTREEIIEKIAGSRSLLRHYKVRRLGLFGSHLRNEASKGSDIDLLIETESGVDLMSVVDLELRLTEILGAKVDLVSVRGLNVHFRPHILKEVAFIEVS